MINDVSRAFSHGRATRIVYVQIPDEDKKPGEEEMCGKLNGSMYGTWDAASNWQMECSQMLIDNGFKQGVATPCVFYSADKGMRTLVHGDDHVSVGQPENLKWMERMLERKYQIKTQVLGPRKEDVQQIKTLNRIISWDNTKGIKYEADLWHVEILIEQLKLADAKTVTILGIKEEGCIQEDKDEKLGDKEASQYRAFVARSNYLSPDRPDIAYSVKEFARNMFSPSRGNWAQLKRLGR